MRSKKLTIGLFMIYIAALTWIILFKMEVNIFSIFNRYASRRLNLIIFAALFGTGRRFAVLEILMNVIIFIPFGIYMEMLCREWGTARKVLVMFSCSFAYEALQYIFAIGMADVTDLAANTLGGILGIWLFYAFQKLFKKNADKILNILALSGTAAGVYLYK